MDFAVAFYVPHMEGVQAGLITGPDFDSGTELVDLYEVDASIESFDSEAKAHAWLEKRFKENAEEYKIETVAGGKRYVLTGVGV